VEPDGTFSANVNLHDGFFRERGLDPAMATAAICHEVEHLREFLALTRSSDGAKVWREHVQKLQADPRLDALDNMVDDVRMNRTVMQRSPSLRPGMERMYTQYASPDANLQALSSGETNPLHLQFAQSLLRDAMLPTETSSVASEVREAQKAVLDRVNVERKQRGLSAARSFNDVVRQITDPSLTPTSRLALTRRYIEPAYQALYREDVDREQQKQSGNSGASDKSDRGSGESNEQKDGGGGGKGAEANPQQAAKSAGAGDATKPAPKNAGQKPEQKPGSDGGAGAPKPAPPEGQPGGSAGEPNPAGDASPNAPASPTQPSPETGAPPGEGGSGTSDEAPKDARKRSIADKIRDIFSGKDTAKGDQAKQKPTQAKGTPDLSKLRPEEVFPEAYKEHAKHRPTAISPKEWEKVAKDLQEKAARGLKPLDPNDPRVQEKRQFLESNAAEHPTEQDWQNFQSWHALRDAAYAVRDDAGRPVIDELRKIFANILSHRRRKRPAPKAPQEEGENLSAEHLVEAWLSLKAGVDSAEVWTVERTKERPAERVGVFDISIAGDLSESMLHDGKDRAQKQATVLLLGALEEFRREIAYVEGDLRDDLAVRTEVWGFGNGPHLLKPLTNRLEPIHCARVAGGMEPKSDYGTHDYTVLKEIREAIENDPRYAEKLKPRNGRDVAEIRRIVLVLTDGDSSNRAKCMQEVAALRALGVKVIGIGITSDGKGAEATYAPDGRVCEDASDLARTTGVLLADLLKNTELGYSDLNTNNL
jgi:hypothetical protein